MSKKKSLRRASELDDFCDTVTTIDCSKCGAVGGSFEAVEYAVEELFSKGWRATNKNCYCPKCAKKYLKS